MADLNCHRRLFGGGLSNNLVNKFGKYLVIFVFFQACSYHLKRSDFILGRVRHNEPQKVFIPVVDNLTVTTGFEGILTSAVREAMTSARGVELVSKPGDADFFLLGSVLLYDVRANSTRQGTSDTELRGGLANQQSSALDLKLRMRVRFQLVEQLDGSGLKKQFWSRVFSADGVFESSPRLNVLGADLSSGSESAPHLNDARELIQVKILSQNIAARVLDQVTQDF